MHHLEYFQYQQFLKQYRDNKNTPQRLGQAFCDFFKLDKSTDLKPIADKIYQLDGYNALAAINHHFQFN